MIPAIAACCLYNHFLKRLEPYYTEEEAKLWMRSPQPLLEDQTANQLIVNGEADKVEWVINTLEELPYL